MQFLVIHWSPGSSLVLHELLTADIDLWIMCESFGHTSATIWRKETTHMPAAGVNINSVSSYDICWNPASWHQLMLGAFQTCKVFRFFIVSGFWIVAQELCQQRPHLFHKALAAKNCAPRHALCETNLNDRWRFYLTPACWRSSLSLKNI